MEKSDIDALKLRLLQNKSKSSKDTRDKNIHDTSETVTYVTTSKKVTQFKDSLSEAGIQVQEKIDVLSPAVVTQNIQTVTNPLLKLIANYVSENNELTMRMLTNDKMEQIDVTRRKPDFLDNNNIPITAAHLLISENGDVKFSTITGKVDEYCIKEKEDIEELLKKFDVQFRLCTGLPATLPEVKYFPGRFQSYLEYPYPHARSKDCLHWHQPSNQVSIRDRLKFNCYRCPPCKRYLNKLANWCKEKKIFENPEEEKLKSKVGIKRKMNPQFEKTVLKKKVNLFKDNYTQVEENDFIDIHHIDSTFITKIDDQLTKG